MNIEDFTLDNKYTKWYISIIKNAQLRASTKKEANNLLGYVEGHHTVPNSLFKNKNIVYLTAREHFICHWLLTKMVFNLKHKQKMHFALSSFLRKTTKQNRLFTGRQFEIARKALVTALTNREVSLETRDKQSKIRKGRPAHNKGKISKKTGPCTETRKLNISKGRLSTLKIKCIHCLKETDPGNFNQYHGDNCKKNPNIDPNILLERSRKNRESTMKAIKNGNHKTGSPNKSTPLICPHCHKTGINKPVMMRHHFDRCKNREFSDIQIHS